MGPKKNEPEWDPEFEPLMKILVGKKGLKTKTASEVGRKKVDYFRGKDFKRFLLEPESQGRLKKKATAAFDAVLDGELPANDKDVELLGTQLIHRGFCYRAKYTPINAPSNATEKPPTKKWPDRLGRTQNQEFDPEGFYVVMYESGSGMQHFLLGLIIAAVLLACMFPVWPIWAKIGVWYVLVIFLTLYFGVFIVRLIVYVVFWVIGFEFWIFPNLNDEYCGLLETFQPIYSFDKRRDDMLTIGIRFGSLLILSVAVQQISLTTSVSDVKDLFAGSYLDLVDWGVDKLTALPDPTAGLLPSLTQLQDEAKAMDADDDTTGKASSAPGGEENTVTTEDADTTEKTTDEGEEDTVNLS